MSNGRIIILEVNDSSAGGWDAILHIGTQHSRPLHVDEISESSAIIMYKHFTDMFRGMLASREQATVSELIARMVLSARNANP